MKPKINVSTVIVFILTSSVLTTAFARINIGHNYGTVSEQVCDENGCRVVSSQTGTQNVHIPNKFVNGDEDLKEDIAFDDDPSESSFDDLCDAWIDARYKDKISLNNWFTSLFIGPVSVVHDQSTVEIWSSSLTHLKHVHKLPRKSSKRQFNLGVLLATDKICGVEQD